MLHWQPIIFTEKTICSGCTKIEKVTIEDGTSLLIRCSAYYNEHPLLSECDKKSVVIEKEV